MTKSLTLHFNLFIDKMLLKFFMQIGEPTPVAPKLGSDLNLAAYTRNPIKLRLNWVSYFRRYLLYFEVI